MSNRQLCAGSSFNPRPAALLRRTRLNERAAVPRCAGAKELGNWRRMGAVVGRRTARRLRCARRGERAPELCRPVDTARVHAAGESLEYVLATQPDEYRSVFVDALRRNVPGRGGDVMNYVEQLIERGRREGRREGRLEGKIRTIEGLLERDIPWSSIEAATGIDEAAFRKFKRQLDAADDGANT